MSQKKPHNSNILRPFGLTTLAMLLAATSIFSSPAPASAHHAADCSDVYTPLSSFVVNGVNANKNWYIQAMNETGVPWEMLAAIHYRETNFSHTNPSNGQGIFQFVNGAGGPYPAGPVSDEEFYRQLKFMANRVQDDYVWRGSIQRERRRLQANEQNMVIVKDTLFSYNGRATVYANQAAHFGFDSTTQPYEGSPYVMNRFDCARARMGMITQDFGSLNGIDTRYGTFTLFARLRGEDFWKSLWYPYSWQVVSQYAYTDQTKTVGKGTTGLFPGDKVYVGLRARNMGTTTWTNTGSNPINVGTLRDTDRNSAFCDPTWLGCNRPTRLVESSVAPGEIGTFEFWYRAPSQPGTYHEYFGLLAEGKQWMNDQGVHFYSTVVTPTFTWQPVDQYAYTDQTKTVGKGTTNLMPGDRFYVGIKAKNTGNMTWNKTGRHTVLMGPIRPIDRGSSFYDSTWLSKTRTARLVEDSVAPGQVGTFEFWVQASNAGAFNEYFAPVVEGVAWMNDPGLNFHMRVGQPTYSWQFMDQYAYTDATKTVGKSTTNLNPGEKVFVGFKAKNTGNVTWRKMGPYPVHVGMTRPLDRLSRFFDDGWLGENRPARLVEDTVAPGQIGTFEFWMKAPSQGGGVYLEYFSLVAEGAAWMNDPAMNFYMSVK